MQNKTRKNEPKNKVAASSIKKSSVKNKDTDNKKNISGKTENRTDKKKSASNKEVKNRNKNHNSSKRTKSEAELKMPLYGSVNTKSGNSHASVRIMFLGGINEIGKNITLFECNDEIVIVDCGMSFPDADMPGIDYVLPDLTYVEKNKDKIKGIFITHAHEDHIGGLPYLLKAVNKTVYCTCLTAGLIEAKLREHRIYNKCKIEVISPDSNINVGEFTVEAIHINHSIPDALAFAIKCSAGTIVHTGDFKIDNTPIDGGVIDLAKLAELGKEGVLCLLSDSTNSERAGYTPSEKNVGETLESLFRRAEGKRIIVASFSSNIHRIQQIINASAKFGRKIFLSGRSLENTTNISIDLGYMNVEDNLILPIDRLKNYNDEDVVIITTGSQGEPMSALSRMAMKDHKKVSIDSNDFIIISATPIPGNEKMVAHTINELMKLGAEVIYEKNLGIHVSGHAAQEDQKLMMNLVKPKYFIPVHGEQKHLRKHEATALSVGIPAENIVVPELGSVVEVSQKSIKFAGTVPVGKIFVDGTGVCDVGKSILRDRKHLSTDGFVSVTAAIDAYTGNLLSNVDVQSKGFVFENNVGELWSFINNVSQKVFDEYIKNVNMDVFTLKTKLKDCISKAIYDKTKRSPIVIVTVLTVE